VFLIGPQPNICKHLLLPLIVAISAQGWCGTHVTGPEYSTIHIDQLLPDITGIAAGNEIFFSDHHRFSAAVVQCAWLLGTDLHALLWVQGLSVNMVHSLYRLHWFIVLPAHRYCGAADCWHHHLRVLVQQDINPHHSLCFEDLTKAITLHIV
jgi:hypothetical protein